MSQASKTLALLGALVGVAGGLGLYAYYGVARTDRVEQVRKEWSEHLFLLGAPEQSPDGGPAPAPLFSSLTVKAKGETTVLERANGAWRLTAPVKAAADKVAVDALVSQLQSAKVKEQVEEHPDPAALEKYGLKEPRFGVHAYAYLPDAKGGGAEDPTRRRELGLEGGIENPFDGSVYVRREGEKPVYSAEGGLRYALEKNTYDLREKELLTLEEPKLQRLEVKGKYALERDPQRAWRLTQPMAGPRRRLRSAPSR